MAISPLRMQIAYSAREHGSERPPRSDVSQQGFNSYAAGDKRYGLSQRRGPNTGMSLDRSGYAKRDQKIEARRQSMLEKMQAMLSGNYASADAQRPIGK